MSSDQEQKKVLSSAITVTPETPSVENVSIDLEQGAATAAAASSSKRLEPTRKLSRHQAFYVFFLDGIGGMALSAGVNFAIAYAMYTTQDTVKNPIRLFQLPNTLAGDAAVTIIVQCILTWFVEKTLVHYDLGNASVQPIGFIQKPSNEWLRCFFFLSSDEESSDAPKTLARKILGLVQQALRGFMLAVVSFFLLWPTSVGILTTVGEKRGGDYYYPDRWAPEIFKLILGGLLGLLTTPLMAMFWLIKAGWEADADSARDL